ncbi:uncharacterized protein SPSK_08018 [Sporothrix schenckii 1099-18]|uniref:Uncharacterized protein n=1 Tax=Sporothrix schenckii 1099-18 TaxID=1397361 RepID=A0A0F2MFI2_SPOSC|nr:uncharacterized protein SPSK_08018 [Sporothrix schenckii 1099-18]KJR88433.1 hypothetical protein SPSK_08018 [Sporothrix schenckii 1099-18]
MGCIGSDEREVKENIQARQESVIKGRQGDEARRRVTSKQAKSRKEAALTMGGAAPTQPCDEKRLEEEWGVARGTISPSRERTLQQGSRDEENNVERADFEVRVDGTAGGWTGGPIKVIVMVKIGMQA